MIFVQYGSVEARAPEEPDLFEAACAAVAAAFSVASDHGLGGVSIELLPDERVRALNAEFRGIDAATDVLTFPSEADNLVSRGDIAIGTGVMRRQAALRGVSVAQEAGFLALHGALHLAGFDDEMPDDLARMRSETERYAGVLALPSGDWHSIYGLEAV